ncbi:tetraacyldisaccharide 4'-kinase [Pseudoxanthomonas wuyuanensis]|uniref:Tetraacyldisaccharide 4'-kinase n=1 Tax=Pseudoxanthomonas wuyuanensis TaxID=1073196 RepID=A0A286CXE8_9GAMM|nr:tetraacyldisaccharide 4'-kinase [Pseudoxanthomonas wuyuanensis]KAF1720824.1 tetraacyldisaccharide 4'-kinase [Pseudoxanthomonas wuyuanensis]SOD51044.1 lipid-A-disaccharide kinase [Pseudoxanthomonas wuyuanensis]
MSKNASKTPGYWFGEQAVPLPARALSRLYGALVALRLRLYRKGWLRSQRLPAPVVVVGNVSVGGTGKTPLTIALVQRLRQAGFKPGVASRGYGRRDPKQARWVDAATAPADGGDEPVLIARQTGLRVRVDRDRNAAARELIAAGCDVIVCDDGLQHYRLQRDIEIEVIDGQRRYGNGRLLPAGPLREPPERGRDCDFRVVNGGEAGFGEWPMRLHSEGALPLRGGRPRPLSSFAGQRVHAIAGIGNPQRFFDMLRGYGIGVVPHAFGDHHVYAEADFSFGSELPVLMTEKDAVKCAAFADDWFYSVPVSAQLPEAFWVALLDRLSVLARPAAAD